MAFEVKDEDQQKQTAQTVSQPQQDGGAMQLGPSSGVVTPQSSPTRTSSPGSFTNIETYLNANQDQAKDLAQKISQPIQTNIDTSKSQGQSAYDTFQSQVGQGTVQLDNNVLQGIQFPTQTWQQPAATPPSSFPNTSTMLSGSNAPTSSWVSPSQGLSMSPTPGEIGGSRDTFSAPQSVQFPGYSNYTNVATTGKTADAKAPLPEVKESAIKPTDLSDDQRTNIQKMLNASYGGPQDIETTGLMQDARTLGLQAKSSADQTANEAGRFSLLGQFVKDPGYAQNQKLLDQALLAAQPAQDVFGGLRTNANQVPGYFDQLQSQADALVPAAKQTTANTKTQSNQLVNKAYDDRLSSMQDLQNKLSLNQNYDFDSLKAALTPALQGSKNYNDPAVQKAYETLTGQKFSPSGTLDPSAYGVNPLDYLQHAAPETLESVVAPEEKSQFDSLASLLGRAQNDVKDTGHLGENPQGASFNRRGYEDTVLQKLSDLSSGSQLQKFLGGPQFQSNGMTNVPMADLLRQGAASVDNDLTGANGEDFYNKANGYQKDIQQFYDAFDQENALRSNLGLQPLQYNKANLGGTLDGSDKSSRLANLEQAAAQLGSTAKQFQDQKTSGPMSAVEFQKLFQGGNGSTTFDPQTTAPSMPNLGTFIDSGVSKNIEVPDWLKKKS